MTDFTLLKVAAGWESAIQLAENGDRWAAYQAARAAADSVGKPLLNIGCPRIYPGKYPCGDVCIDNSPKRLQICRSPRPVLGDVRRIPFPDGHFGAALCCHVLEHLPSVADARRALAELHRVAGKVFVCSPYRQGLMAWLHPEHQIWVDQLPDGTIAFEQRSRPEWTKQEWVKDLTTVGIAGSLAFTGYALTRYARRVRPEVPTRPDPTPIQGRSRGSRR